MANPTKFHPAAAQSATPIAQIQLNLASDVDLTDPTASGQTGGYCARALRASAAGNIKFTDVQGNTSTEAVVAGQTLLGGVRKVFSSSGGTTATVTALL